jgi:hypothetical protein
MQDNYQVNEIIKLQNEILLYLIGLETDKGNRSSLAISYFNELRHINNLLNIEIMSLKSMEHEWKLEQQRKINENNL